VNAPRTIMVLLILGYTLCVIWAIKAKAEECYSPELNKQGFLDTFPNAVIANLSKEDTATFLSAVTAAHPEFPEKSHSADSGQVFEVPGLPKVVISLIKDGCVTFTLSMPPDHFIEYMTEKAGSPT
jgi:hypothetical protein